MTEITNRAKDPWPIRVKDTVNCTGSLAGDAKYYTYTLTDPTKNGTIECYNGNGAVGYVYYARFTCADKAKVSLSWCYMIESKADWIAGTCQQASLMRRHSNCITSASTRWTTGSTCANSTTRANLWNRGSRHPSMIPDTDMSQHTNSGGR